MTPTHAAVAEALTTVERELRAAGYWQDDPLPDAAYDFKQAFAMDTMAFTQWLQFVFVPNVRRIIDSEGDFPPSSMVATQAIRELDGAPDADGIIDALSEFDALFRG